MQGRLHTHVTYWLPEDLIVKTFSEDSQVAFHGREKAAHFVYFVVIILCLYMYYYDALVTQETCYDFCGFTLWMFCMCMTFPPGGWWSLMDDTSVIINEKRINDTGVVWILIWELIGETLSIFSQKIWKKKLTKSWIHML